MNKQICVGFLWYFHKVLNDSWPLGSKSIEMTSIAKSFVRKTTVVSLLSPVYNSYLMNKHNIMLNMNK